MPVQTAAACLVNADCPVVPLPAAVAGCVPTLTFGGVNDLYVIPCTEAMTEVNILDTTWWTALVTNSHLGNIGLGLGSIGKKATKTEKVASGLVEQIISITWALKYMIKTIDKSSADITRTQLNAILTKNSKFQLMARMSDGDDVVLPIGKFSMSDIDWVVPEGNEDVQNINFELSWIEFAVPKLYTVTGLSAIVPKA